MSDWKKELKELFDDEHQSRVRQKIESEGKTRVKRFITEVVEPAFEEIAEELKEYERDIDVEIENMAGTIRVYHEGHEEFYFSIRSRPYKKKEFSFPVLPKRDEKGEYYRAEVYLKDGPLYHDVTTYSKEQIIREFLHEYKRHMQWNL
jgi:choline/glycine/proline betaine transport protein